MANETVMASDAAQEAPIDPAFSPAVPNDIEQQMAPTEAPPESRDAEIEPEVAFSWQASEYVHHHKSIVWYLALTGIVVVLISLAVWLKLWLEIGVFITMAVAVVVYARKPPQTMLYELTSGGIQINGVLRPFSEFRSFGVIPDDEWHSIDLEPAQRLKPRIAVLFDPADLPEITAHLERHLPREDRQMDIIERIARYVRF